MSPRRRNAGVARASGTRPRAGFTLVELLVAIMIFAVGMLGLAATAASVTRLMGGARRQTIAATIVQSRIEQIRSAPCSTLTSGADTSRGVINKWTITPVTRGVTVIDSVRYPTTRGTRIRTYNTSLSC